MERIDIENLKNITGGCQRWARRYNRERLKFASNEDVLSELLDAYDDCIAEKFSRN